MIVRPGLRKAVALSHHKVEVKARFGVAEAARLSSGGDGRKGTVVRRRTGTIRVQSGRAVRKPEVKWPLGNGRGGGGGGLKQFIDSVDDLDKIFQLIGNRFEIDFVVFRHWFWILAHGEGAGNAYGLAFVLVAPAGASAWVLVCWCIWPSFRLRF